MYFDELRKEYVCPPLDEANMLAQPVEQLRTWVNDAKTAGVDLANAMTLATATPSGVPTARVVLLKTLDEHGLVFFTNYESQKAQDLEANSAVSLLFWWRDLHRQVRVEGTVARVSAAESDAYFATRPRESNLSAMASPQSRRVASRTELETRVNETMTQWAERELERPAHWGGYRVSPRQFEFWQGRPDRLHDRVCYELVDGRWKTYRLAP